MRAARRQVERAGIDPVTGLHTEEPPTLADREPTEEGELPRTILVQFWSNFGPILVQFWFNFGLILVQFWSNFVMMQHYI